MVNKEGDKNNNKSTQEYPHFQDRAFKGQKLKYILL